MSSVRASDIPEEQNMWTDVWNWRKKYYNPEKYGKLCQDIVIAILDEVKGRWKKC